MSHRTFPKERTKKLKEEIRDLKSLLRQKDKEINFLRQELKNLVKPIRARKPVIPAETPEEWRQGFVKRFKKEVLGES